MGDFLGMSMRTFAWTSVIPSLEAGATELWQQQIYAESGKLATNAS